MASLDSVPTMTLITVYEQFHLFTGFSQCAFGECECSSFTFYLLSPLILAFAFLLFFLSLFFCFVMHLRQTVSYRFVLVLFFLVCSCFWRFCACFCSNFFFLELHFCGWQGHSFCIATTWQCCQKFYESVFVGAFCFHFFWLKKESHVVFFLVASFWVAGTPFFLFRECFQIVSLKCLSWHLFLALFRQVIYLKIGTFYGQLQCICVFSPQFEIQFFFCPNLALTWTEVSNVAKFRIQNENKNIWPSGTRYEYCVPYNWTDIKWGKGWCEISDKLLFLALFGQGGGFSYCCNDMISPKRDLQSQARLTLCFFFSLYPNTSFDKHIFFLISLQAVAGFCVEGGRVVSTRIGETGVCFTREQITSAFT